LGFQILIFLSVIPTSTMQFLLPREASGKQEKKIEKTILIIAVGLSLLAVLLLPLMIPVLLPNFENSIIPAQIMSLAVIPLTVMSIFQSKLIGREKTKFVLMGAIIRISTLLILLFLLGEQLGIIGFALAILFSLVAHSFAATIFYKMVFVNEVR